MRHGNAPRVMLEIFEHWLDCARNRETGPVRMDPAIHTHVFGRSPGLFVYEDIIKVAKAAGDVWIGTRSEAVAHVKRALER